MNNEAIRELLVNAGLRQKAVEKILEEYGQMQSRFQNGEYAEIGVNVGRFCEGVVHILRLEIGSELKSETVREFAEECVHSDFAENYSIAISQHIPNMLHTAYDIRSNRDSAHLNLETAVNRADARLGIALCSSILVELIREFVVDDEIDNIDNISKAIDQLSSRIEENPLESLVVSRYDFDRSQVAETLDDVISIVEEEQDVQPGPKFFDLDNKQQVIALALGRLVAYDLEYVEQIGENSSWYEERSNYSEDRVKKQLDEQDCIIRDFSLGEHHIPGYQVINAIEVLTQNDD